MQLKTTFVITLLQVIKVQTETHEGLVELYILL